MDEYPIDLAYSSIVEYISPFHDPKRSESASFLIWYLLNYYNLDEVEAVDCVCDSRGDRGIDGLYVNENLGTIDVFQAKLFQTSNSRIGDKLLREFVGSITQLATLSGLDEITNNSPNSELSRLIQRQKVKELIHTYKIRGIFLSNSEYDANAVSFVTSTNQEISTIGRTELADQHISRSRETVVIDTTELALEGNGYTQYEIDKEIKSIIAPVPARQLIKLRGIQDQSLFALNVRASLGNTKINKDIVKSIKDPAVHKNFPLFHNGITIVCETAECNAEAIKISNYFVVNGCQSLNSIFLHKNHLTDNLRILTKIIQVGNNNKLSEQITAYSNNQNGVKPRDFKSNNPIQIKLQNEINKKFKGKYAYQTKRGEIFPENVIVISNEEAGLNLMSFDLEEPWGTHRTYQVFEDKFADIFGRPEVDCFRIIFLYHAMQTIKNNMYQIENSLISKYGITKFLILYFLKKILVSDQFGVKLSQDPKPYVIDSTLTEKLLRFFERLISLIIVEVNAYISNEQQTQTKEILIEFPYREKLRDKDFVEKLGLEIVSQRRRDLIRKKDEPLEVIFNSEC